MKTILAFLFLTTFSCGSAQDGDTDKLLELPEKEVAAANSSDAKAADDFIGVASSDKLPECSANNQGQKAYVENENEVYLCKGAWRKASKET